jgi:hypothetical protein
MEDLRNHLFATLEALRDEENPMELDRAKTIANVADKLIASAKVEVDFIEATGERDASKFFEKKQSPQLQTINGKSLSQ